MLNQVHSRSGFVTRLQKENEKTTLETIKKINEVIDSSRELPVMIHKDIFLGVSHTLKTIILKHIADSGWRVQWMDGGKDPSHYIELH